MYKLKVPIALGGIAGSLLVTHAGRIHWETVDNFGEVITFQTTAFHHPDLPGRLFSPQTYCRREKQGQQVDMVVDGDHSVWRVNKSAS